MKPANKENPKEIVPKENSGLSGFFNRIENAPVGMPAVLATLLSIAFVRIILEYTLEASRALEPFASFILFLLYFSSVLAVLWFSTWVFSGRSVLQAGRTVAAFSFLLWLPPALDLFFSKGEGYILSYVFAPVSLVGAFSNFCATCIGVSPGLRLEVAATVLVLGAYVFHARKSWLWAVAAGTAAYVFVLFGAFFPGILMRMLHHPYPDVFLLREVLSSYALLLAGVTLLFLHREGLVWKKITARIRWERSLHYLGLALFGAVLGVSHWQHPWPGVLLPLAAYLAAVFFAFEAAVWLNDRADRIFENPKNLKKQNLADQDLFENQTIALFFGLSFVLALAAGYATLLWILFALALSAVYSFPPLRLRRHVAPASLVLAFCSVAVFTAGWALGLSQPEQVPEKLPFVLAGMVLGMVALAAPFKDLKDAETDRSAGVFTLATWLSLVDARRVTALLLLLTGLWVAWTAGMPLWFGALCGVLSGGLALKAPIGKPMERGIFFAEALLLLGVVAHAFGMF